MESKTASPFVLIRIDGKHVQINPKKIIFLHSEGDYVKVIMEKQHHLLRCTFKHICKKIEHYDFCCQVHSRYILNLHYIRTIAHKLIDIGDMEIPLHKDYAARLLSRFLILNG